MITTQEWRACTFPAMSLPGLGFRVTLASWSWKAFPLPLSQIFLVPSLLLAVLAICLTVLIMSETKPRCLQPLKGMYKAKTTFSPRGIRRNKDIQYHWMRVWSFYVFIIQTPNRLEHSSVHLRWLTSHAGWGLSMGLQHPLFILICCHFYWYRGASTKGSYFKWLLLLVTVHCCSYRRCVYGFLYINNEQMKI